MSKRVLLALALLMASVAFPCTSTASGFTPPPPPPETASIQPTAWSLLKDCASFIDNLGLDVYCSGYTTTQFAVESVSIRIYLQRWDGASWVNVAIWYDENWYSSEVWGDHSRAVAPGYYYRVKAVHSASDGLITETATSYTGSIYVQ